MNERPRRESSLKARFARAKSDGGFVSARCWTVAAVMLFVSSSSVSGSSAVRIFANASRLRMAAMPPGSFRIFRNLGRDDVAPADEAIDEVEGTVGVRGLEDVVRNQQGFSVLKRRGIKLLFELHAWGRLFGLKWSGFAMRNSPRLWST